MTFEGTAITHLEKAGCSDIALTRTGSQSFTYDATCDGKFCSGELTLSGGSSQSSQTCTSVPPKARPGTAANPKPGGVVLGGADPVALAALARALLAAGD